jgi:D-3-phosphoglycerate dehydrogenase / 2-oxoglutarate reductase
MKKVLHLDSNHPVIWDGLAALGFENIADYTSSYEQIVEQISEFDGIIVRSRIPIDSQLLNQATQLRFIGRIGAGLENIDTHVAQSKGIYLAAAPEGNRNAVGEHTLGMLLSLLNKLHTADREVRQGLWRREENRGVELDGKTVGIIGYGNMGKQFAKKLRGFDTTVLCYDIREGIEDANAKQVSLSELQSEADIVSLHLPQTPDTIGIINQQFIEQMHKPFWILNTGRGSAIRTSDLVNGLKSGKILGAGLDVLEYESKSFTSLFDSGNTPEEFNYLINSDNVLLSPHVGGWSRESYYLLSKIVFDKITDFLERQ